MAGRSNDPGAGGYHGGERESATAHSRLRSFTILVSLLFLVLLLRFWYLQIAQGDFYQQEAERNRRADIELPAPRGIIRDRHGVLLATTRPAFSVAILPAEVVPGGLDALLARLAVLLHRPKEELAEDYEKNRIGRFRPVPVARDVPMDVVTAVAEEQPYLPGVVVQSDPVRRYPQGAFATHLLGYVREINGEELARLRDQGYRMGDVIGKAGVEKLTDIFLRGNPGRQSVQRDAYGNLLRILGSEPPVAGNTVNLTLDHRVQKAAEDKLADKLKELGAQAGAAVAIDPRNGDVLALASYPTYDPTIFTRRLDPKEYREKIGNNPKYPLQNRAVSSAYPPGSTFKMVTATALLQNRTITTGTTAFCPGFLVIGKPKRCWSTHGTVNIYSAISKSCDVFFYKYALALSARNPDPIAEWADRFGLGRKTGIPLPAESSGNIPWRKKYKHWYPGDTANISIGQGDIQTTPLQIARMISVVANGGTLYKPRVARNVTDLNGRIIEEFPVEGETLKGDDAIRPEVLKVVREGLRQTVAAGTGRVANLEKIAVAGKTGSAEHSRTKQAHAWFCCYAPYENPTIAIAVLVEEGGHGSSSAGPVARAMLEAYFGISKEEAGPVPVVQGD